MIYKEKILDDAVVKHILNFYEFSKFRDGSDTGPKSKEIKDNTELYDPDHKPALDKLFLSHFEKNVFVRESLMACRFSNPMFLKYEENMHYSFHNDFFHQNGVRTDYSVTVFLSDPSEYEGGELNIKIGNQDLVFKEEPGSAIIYPTGLWHTVNQVTSGSRKVVVVWFQSVISDPYIRDACCDIMDLIKRALDEEEDYELSRNQMLTLENMRFKLLRRYGQFD
jgi:PKHD-type hydroxylase